MASELSAKPRIELGKKNKALRKKGLIPAVLYGEGIATQSISVSSKDFEKAYREVGESSLLKLDVEGKSYNVLIQDTAHDPVRGDFLHADFHAVRMDKAIKAKVPLEFMGESGAIKNDGATLVKVLQEIEVEALPQDLPHDIKVDISLLVETNSKIFIRDIKLPPGVKTIAGGDEVVAIAEPPRSEEDLAALKEVPTAEVKEVATEQEVKRSEMASKEKEKEEEK